MGYTIVLKNGFEKKIVQRQTCDKCNKSSKNLKKHKCKLQYIYDSKQELLNLIKSKRQYKKFKILGKRTVFLTIKNESYNEFMLARSKSDAKIINDKNNDISKHNEDDSTIAI